MIDYLLQTGLTSRIRHFSLEYHIFPDWPAKALYPNLLQTYKRLKEAGFYKYFTGLHPLDHRPKHFNIQADVCYVNVKYMMRWYECILQSTLGLLKKGSFLSAVKLTETATLSQLFSYVIELLDVLSQRDIALCTERRQNIFISRFYYIIYFVKVQ